MYLDVVLDEIYHSAQHLKLIATNCLMILLELRQVMKVEWTSRVKNNRILHKGIMKPILIYAASAWRHRLKSKTFKKYLLSIQRKLLLLVKKAYRTVPTVVLPVLANVYPLVEIRAGRHEYQTPTSSNW